MPAERYDDEVDLSAENNSHTMVVRAVPRGARVLDLGCATGQLAGVLTSRGCSVVGVDADADSVALARDRCASVVHADLETLTGEALAEYGPFDVIVAADLLEHLKAPERLLREVAPLLAAHGYLVTSIPNVAHGSVRLALLAGAFPYQEVGLLDDTHIRFYTSESMPAMLRAGGFELVWLGQTTLPPLEGSVLKDVDVSVLPPDAVRAVVDDPEAYTYQFIAVSFPAEVPDSGLPAVLRSAYRDLVRTRADAKEAAAGFAAADDAEARRVLRDAAMRAEASATVARRRLAGLEDYAATAAEAVAERDGLRVRVAELEVLAARAEVGEARAVAAEATLAEIYGSRLWTLGRVYRRLRRLL